MGEARLRALERRLRETGAPADEAALLAEALRVGALERWRVDLAAALDHGPAREVVGDPWASVELPLPGRPEVDLPPPPLPGEDDRLVAWVARFERWGHEPLARAALAAARHVLPLAAGAEADPGAPLRAAEAWLSRPPTERGEPPARLPRVPPGEDEGSQAARTAAFAASLLPGAMVRRDDALVAIREALWASTQAALAREDVAGLEARVAAGLRERVRAELLRWALSPLIRP